MDKFLIYYFISGALMFCWFYYDFNYKGNEEAEDAIADLTWNTGIKREHIKVFLYSMAILFGWLMLPFEIASGILGEK